MNLKKYTQDKLIDYRRKITDFYIARDGVYKVDPVNESFARDFITTLIKDTVEYVANNLPEEKAKYDKYNAKKGKQEVKWKQGTIMGYNKAVREVRKLLGKDK